MKKNYNYRIYLLISLISLFVGGLLSMLGTGIDSEGCALVAFIFFSIAVIMVALEEFFSLRPNVAKKLKSLFLIWKK